MPKITIARDILTHNGQRDTLRNWCARLRLDYAAVAQRYRRMEKPVDTHALFNPIEYRSSGGPRDLPTTTIKNRALRDLVYHSALDLAPQELQAELLRMTNYDAVAVRDNLRVIVTTGLAQLFNKSVPAPEPGVLGTLEFTHDPMYVIFNRLPPAQQSALLQAYPDTTELSAELEYIVSSLIPKAIARVLGVSETGEINADRS